MCDILILWCIAAQTVVQSMPQMNVMLVMMSESAAYACQATVHSAAVVSQLGRLLIQQVCNYRNTIPQRCFLQLLGTSGRSLHWQQLLPETAASGGTGLGRAGTQR